MTMLVVGLYDQGSEANKVIDALKNAGFRRAQMERIEKRGKGGAGFFKSLFSAGEDEEVSVDDLREMGISLEDARFYAQAIRDGRTLLTIRCDDTETERVRQIMGRFRLSDYGRGLEGQPEPPAVETAAPREVTSSQLEMPGVEPGPGPDYRGREVQEEFIHDASVVSADLGEEKEIIDDRTEAVTNGSDYGQMTFDELYLLSEQDGGRYQHFEPDMRAHYDEFYGPDEQGFEEFDRGYRYGMALAEYEPYRGLTWAEVESEAQRGWESFHKGTWHRFRAAVEYGWNRIRGDEDQLWPRSRL